MLPCVCWYTSTHSCPSGHAGHRWWIIQKKKETYTQVQEQPQEQQEQQAQEEDTYRQKKRHKTQQLYVLCKKEELYTLSITSLVLHL